MTPHYGMKIVSGGQTGVDRAALDAAMACGLLVGGWCPKARRAEDGPISTHYPLVETPTASYANRTRWNVRDSDATVILYRMDIQGGTQLTATIARAMQRPLLIVSINAVEAARSIADFIHHHDVRCLNIAGPRESEDPGIYAAARRLLQSVFEAPSGR